MLTQAGRDQLRIEHRGSSLLYNIETARTVLPRAYRLACEASDALCVDMALVKPEVGAPGLAVAPFFDGNPDKGERQVQPFRDLAVPLQDNVDRVPYLDFRNGGDATFSLGCRYYWKAQFPGDLPDAAFDALIEAYCKAPSTGCLGVLQHVGVAIARVTQLRNVGRTDRDGAHLATCANPTRRAAVILGSKPDLQR